MRRQRFRQRGIGLGVVTQRAAGRGWVCTFTPSHHAQLKTQAFLMAGLLPLCTIGRHCFQWPLNTTTFPPNGSIANCRSRHASPQSVAVSGRPVVCVAAPLVARNCATAASSIRSRRLRSTASTALRCCIDTSSQIIRSRPCSTAATSRIAAPCMLHRGCRCRSTAIGILNAPCAVVASRPSTCAAMPDDATAW